MLLSRQGCGFDFDIGGDIYEPSSRAFIYRYVSLHTHA